MNTMGKWWGHEQRIPREYIPQSAPMMAMEDEARPMPAARSVPRPAPPARTVASVYAEREECTQELAKLLMRASDVVERREELSIELRPLIEADELKHQAQLNALAALKELILSGQQRIVDIREEAEENAAERASDIAAEEQPAPDSPPEPGGISDRVREAG